MDCICAGRIYRFRNCASHNEKLFSSPHRNHSLTIEPHNDEGMVVYSKEGRHVNSGDALIIVGLKVETSNLKLQTSNFKRAYAYEDLVRMP